MPDYTITLTDPQQVVLAAALIRVNQWRASQNPPLSPLTEAGLITELAKDGFMALRDRFDGEDFNTVVNGWKTLTSAEKSQILAIVQS